MPSIPSIPWTLIALLGAVAAILWSGERAIRAAVAAGQYHGVSRFGRLAPLRGLVAGNPLLLVIAGIGFSLSFETISNEAAHLGMPGWHPLYPIGIDVGILALVIEARRAIDDGRSDLVPRIGAWALSLLTIYVNALGSATWGLGRILHIVMPSLWVMFLELTRWRKLRKVRAGKADRIPRARWLADWPWRVTGMKRRMVLNNVTSYPVACAREEARMLATDLATAVWGHRWRRDAPALFRHQVRNGTFPAGVAEIAEAAATGTSPAMAEPVSEWVARVATEAGQATARVQAERERLERQQQEAEDRQRERQQDGHDDRREERQADRHDDRQKDRQRGRQPSATERAKRSAKAKRLLLANPAAELADIAKQAGVSERTVSRLKADLAKGADVIQMAR